MRRSLQTLAAAGCIVVSSVVAFRVFVLGDGFVADQGCVVVTPVAEFRAEAEDSEGRPAAPLQADVTTDRFKADAVALGSYDLDVHAVRHVPAPDAVGGLIPEGGIGKGRVKPCEVPYRALLPKRSEAVNLLVAVCPSASHVAYSTVLMEPVFMMLGHACGLAAALSLDRRVGLHDLPVDRLQAKLREQKQVFDARPFTREWPFREPK